MSPIPGKGHDPRPQELTTKDGRRFTLKVDGLEPRADPRETVKPPPDPPRDDPRTGHDPHTQGF